MTQHVVQISAYYPPHLGGQENAVQGLAEQLAQKGHVVDVVTSTQGGSSKGMTTENGVSVWRLEGFVFGHAPVMPHFFEMLSSLATPQTIFHLHIGQAFTPELVYLAARRHKVPYIAELHIDFEPSGPAGVLLPLYKRLVLRRVLNAAACVAVLNEKTARIVQERYGYQGNVAIVSNGIDELFFQLKRRDFTMNPPKKLRLLFVGRLTKQKNILCLLQAIKKTKRRVQLDIVGDGEKADEIAAYIKEHKLASSAVLHGKLPRQKVMKFYESNHVLVMPSLYEAQPLVLLEAMAARIPIIGTNVIGVAEHINGVGIISEPTVDGLVKAIEEYFERYEDLPQMVERGYKKAQKLSWPQMVKSYERLYESILDN